MKRTSDMFGCDTKHPIGFTSLPRNDLVNHLLPDVLKLTFTKLNDLDLLSAAQVNSFWRRSIQQIAKENILELKIFVIFFTNNTHNLTEIEAENLRKSTTRLLKLKSNQDEFHLKKFISLRKKVKEIFLHLLIKMPLSDLSKVRKITSNDIRLHHFEDVFDLAETYKNIECLYKNPTSDAIRKICQDLAKILARTEKNGTNEKISITISKRFLTKGTVSRIQILSLLESIIFKTKKFFHNILYQEVAKELAIHGDAETSFQYNLRLPEKERQYGYENFYKPLALRGQCNEALIFANEIWDDKKRAWAHDFIFSASQQHFFS